EQWSNWQAEKEGGSARPAGPEDPETPEGRALRGGVGLLVVRHFHEDEAKDRAYVAILRDGLNALRAAGSRCFVVDLRGNTGGNMWPMIAGLRAILGEPPYGYWEMPTGAKE